MIHRIKLILTLCAICCLSIYADGNQYDRQILIFNKNGEINILHSAQMDRIELSKFDNYGVEHNDFVSQVFYRKDGSSLSIHIADIDSVAFGSRSIVDIKSDVRRLSDTEVEHISRYNGNCIEYLSGTPLDIIVKPGEIVYYDRMTKVLPYGLCCRIVRVNTSGNNARAEVEELTASDIFDRFLYTGGSNDGNDNSPKRLQEVDDMPHLFEFNLPEHESQGIKFGGMAKALLGLQANDIVIDAVNKFYHAVFTFYLKPFFSITAQSADSGEIKLTTENHIPLKINYAGGMFSVGLDLKGFTDFVGEAGIEYEFSNESTYSIEWTRKNGQDTFSELTIDNGVNSSTTQKVEAFLKGELFAGILADLNVGALFDRIGAGIEIKTGPSVDADFSLSLIEKLAETHEPEKYGKANLNLNFKVSGEPYAFYLSNWGWGDQIRTYLPFKTMAKVELGTLHLFPEFNSRSVLATAHNSFVNNSRPDKAISVSSFSKTDIEYPLEIGFETYNRQTGESLSVNSTIGKMYNHEKSSQTFSDNILYDPTIAPDVKDIVVSPVFKYRDFLVKAKPVEVKSDISIANRISSVSCPGIYLVSGATNVGQHTEGETTYIAGNILPLGLWPDDKFRNSSDPHEYVYIGKPGSDNLSIIGKWEGVVMDEKIIFSFNEDKTGEFNGKTLAYEINSPIFGGVSIILSDLSTISFFITELTEQTMSIIPKGSKKTYTLERIE